MPFVRRFYFKPRVTESNIQSNIPSPVDNLWKIEGRSDCVKYDLYPGTERQQSFQDLPVEDQIKQLYHKKILGILNKVTSRTFEEFIGQIRSECRDKTFVTMLAQIIFTKALHDEIYLHLYAKFCDSIMSYLHKDSRVYFRDVLYDLCEIGCRHLLMLKDEDILSINEDERYVYKRRLMSLVRFIGEMTFINDALFSHDYCLNLTQRLIEVGDELHWESLYCILCKCAFSMHHISWPENVWWTVSELSKGLNPNGAAVSSRIRFMFMSLVEARIGQDQRDVYSPPNSPNASDSDNNDMLPDTKGF